MDKKQIKLEDIRKESVYTVPDGYFDQLPGMIRSRISAKESKPQLVTVAYRRLAFAIPVIALLALAYFNYWEHNGQKEQSANELLAQVETEYLISYLATTDISTEELLDEVGSEIELYELEPGLFDPDQLDEEEMIDMIEQYDLDIQYL